MADDKFGEGMSAEEIKEYARQLVSHWSIEFHPADRAMLDAIADDYERRELARKINEGEAGIWADKK